MSDERFTRFVRKLNNSYTFTFGASSFISERDIRHLKQLILSKLRDKELCFNKQRLGRLGLSKNILKRKVRAIRGQLDFVRLQNEQWFQELMDIICDDSDVVYMEEIQ